MHQSTQHQKQQAQRGLTMIEVTLVISVLLGLISFAFMGTNAYKRGADRAMCIIQVTEVQKALRSFCNYQEFEPGDSVPGLKAAIIGPDRFIEEEPICPAGGTYTFYTDEVPELGETFMSCSLELHTPTTTYRW